MSKKITLLICLLLLIGQTRATYIPVTIASGYNADVVANGIGLPSASSTHPLDAAGGGANFVFVAEDYQNNASCAPLSPPNFLPTGGLLTSPISSTPGLTYQLADYSGMNCLHLEAQHASGTLTFATPVAAGEIFLLANSGSGISLLDVVITFTNNDTQQINGLSIADWYGGANVVIKAARVGRTTTTCAVEVGTSPSGPNLYQYLLPVMPANLNKQIASISFTKTNATGTGFPNIMGLSINTPCQTPGAQPTALLTTATTSQIDGSFTAATGTPDGYLVVRYMAGSTPVLPADGTTYAPGAGLGTGTVIATGAATTFSTTGLFANTAYNFYIYSYNSACGGGPVYNTIAPLTGAQSTSLCGGPGNITIPVGPLEIYTSLTTAIADLGTTGISGPVIIELMAGYDGSLEPTYPIVFPYNPCISAANNLTIRPAAGVTGMVISSSATGPVIDFDGAGNITIDGRPGGIGAMDPGNLKIISTSSSGAAIRFANDATGNTITYCDIQGENTSSTSGTSLSGVIYFGGGVVSGNDNNTITYCDIHGTASGFPTMGISGYGSITTPALYNDNNNVSNCNIFDVFSPGSASTGIKLHQGNNAWTIMANSFYQTAPRTYTAVQTHRAIWVTPNSNGVGTMTEGSGFNIIGNYIGGSAPFVAGAPMEMTAGTATQNVRYMGMDISVGLGTNTSIIANVIQNIVLNTGSTVAASLCGIYQNAGNTTIAANFIGDINTPGSLTLNRTGTSTTLGTVIGIRLSGGSNGVNTAASNNIGGITTTATAATVGHSITGIDVTGGTNNDITGNTIGQLNANNTATTGVQSVNGIVVSGGTTSLVAGNTIHSLTNGHTGTGSGQTRGIHVSGSQTQINGNTIYELTNTTASGGSGVSAAVAGISVTTAGGAIQGNTIYLLKSTALTTATNITGLYVSAAATVAKNKIYWLMPSSTAPGAVATGIHMAGGALLVANNMIHLGYDDMGNSLTNATSFRGISRTGSAAASGVYYNSIYVGGANVDATATTPTYAFYRETTPGDDDTVLNNIFVNERSGSVLGGGKHYAAYLSSLNAIYINHNLYLANGTEGVMGYNGADVAVYMPNWAPGDFNSLSGNPQFINNLVGGGGGTPDLHINFVPTPVADAGIPVAAVTDDFNGAPRDPASPDIGLHEGTFIPATMPVISAATTNPAGNQCTPVDRLVTVTVSPVTAATLYYAYNGVAQPPVTMTGGPASWTGTIPAPPVHEEVTWGIGVTDGNYIIGYTGTSYTDGNPQIIALADVDTVCSGEDVTLIGLAGSQGIAAIGSGSTTTPTGTSAGAQVSPFLHYYGNCRSQYLIPAADLQAADLVAGNFTSLAMDFVGLGANVDMNNVSISMVATTQTALNTFENNNLIQVFSASTLTPVAGINTYPFSTPFYWDGVSNLVIQICYINNNSGNGSTAYTVKSDPTGYVAHRYVRSDGNQPGMCTANTGSTSGNSNARPQFFLGGMLAGTGGLLTWTWSPSSLTGDTITVTPINTTLAPITETHYATATDATTGCFSTTSVDIIVKPIPDLPIATSSVQCGIGIPAATVTAIGNGLLLWYDQPTGGNLIQTGGNSYTGTITATTNFYVSELDGSCEGGRATVTAMVNMPDPVTATPDGITVCPNTLLTLEATQTGTNQNYTYTWTADPEPGSGITGSATGVTVGITPTGTGTYTYVVTAEDATGSSVCLTYDTIQITLSVPPSATIIPDVDTACSGATVTLDAVGGLPAIVPIGTGSITTPTGTSAAAQVSPFLHYYGNCRSQYLIPAADLQAANLVAGNFTSLAMDFVGLGANVDMNNVSISMVATTQTALNTFENNNLIQVFSASTLTPVAGINTYPFSTPFYWDGMSNLVIQICYINNNSGNGSTAYTVKADPTSYIAHRYVRSDGNQPGMCTANTGSTSGNHTSRPQFMLGGNVDVGGYGASLTWSWTPTGLTGQQITINPVNTTTGIILETHSVSVTDPATGCINSTSIDIPVQPLPDLPMVTSSTQCGTAIPGVTAIAVGSGMLMWYDQAVGGTLLQAGGSTYAGNISTTTTFYISELDGSCEGARAQATAAVTPPDPVTAMPDGISVCPNVPLTLDVTQSGSNQNYTYDWTADPEPGSGITGSVSGSSVSITPTSAGTYAYMVTATDGACVTYDTVYVTVDVVPDVVVTPVTGNAVLCGSNPVILTAGAETILFNEDFNGIAYSMTNENFSTGTTPSAADWTIHPDGYSYGSFGPITFNTPTGTGFVLTNSDAVGSGATVDTRLVSPVINTSGYSSLSLSFAHYFRARVASEAFVEVSTDGGTTWSIVDSYTGSDVGAGNSFAQASFDLTSYVNNPAFRFRFRFDADWDWWWAIDDVVLTGVVNGLAVSWDATPAGAGLPAGAGIADPANSAIAITPTPGGSYTYTATVATTAGCPSVGSAVLNITQTPVTALAATGATGAGTHVPGTSYQYTDASCNLIATVTNTTGGTSFGIITAGVTVDGSVSQVNGYPYLQRHYVISAANSGVATVILYATQAEFDAYNLVAGTLPQLPSGGIDNGNIRVSKFTDGTFTPGTGELITPTSVVWNAVDNWWEITLNITGFSHFFIHTGTSGPLFVNLKNISAVNNGDHNRVDWTTMSQKDVDRYVVERSADGRNFNYLGTVPAQQTAISYSFRDDQPFEGMSYYRLRIYSISGDMQYSSTVQAYMDVKGRFMVEAFPNPVGDHERLTLRIHGTPGNNASATVTDATGKLIQTIPILDRETTIRMYGMAAGVYFIRYSDDQHTKTIKVNKQ